MKGKLFAISGPSGVGKNSVLNRVMQLRDRIQYSVSATSRPMRPGEIDGKSYYFVTREQFEQMIAAGELLEHACYAGNYYGTPRRPVEQALANGISIVLEIDVQGGLQVLRRRPDAISVFIAPPSFAELKRRLTGRGDTPPEVAARRLQVAAQECAVAPQYGYTIINDDLCRAVGTLEAILTAEACRSTYCNIELKEEP